MICVSIQDRNYEEILGILASPDVEMAEIRLDRCGLSDAETEDLFANSDTPLVAVCRIAEVGQREAQRRLRLAIEAGARFADVEIEAPVQMSKYLQKLCTRCGTELIRSYHNFDGTPSDEVLQMALARCFRYGADIAKVVTRCDSPEDTSRVLALYSVILEDIGSMEGRLIAFGMGESASGSRVECLRRSAPFTYACLDAGSATAPGQIPVGDMYKAVYGGYEAYVNQGLRMPCSKSFAQRAIIAAALAEGTSHLGGYTPCDDSESAIRVARVLGAEVTEDGGTLTVRGTGPIGSLQDIDRIDVGESGLLARLMIPLSSVLCEGPVSIEGRGTLPNRPLTGAADLMAAFGVVVRGGHVPVSVKGPLIPGTADIPGSSGSQLISGLLMALPLCGRHSSVFVGEPKSIPYMYITLDVLRHFGISTRTEMEGDAEMLERQDWSYCSGISFSIDGNQRYRAADFDLESDWSAAAPFMVAGAVFGNVSIDGLDSSSLQADLGITDILVDAGAIVSMEDDDRTVCVRKAPLEAFSCDLNNAPDLFPVASVLAAFCAGESRLSGIGRLSSKESKRCEAIVTTLTDMGVQVTTEGDDMVISGETLASRILNRRLIRSGRYSSFHDHRMAMAIKVASLGADGPVMIDDEACVAKSFPEFFKTFDI